MDFMRNHNKTYSSKEELSERYRIFKTNLKKMKNKKKNAGHDMGVTRFMDMTPQEFNKIYLNLDIKLTDLVAAQKTKDSWFESHGKRLLQTAPATWDWRAKGGVSPVKDQGYCGSCYAFAAVATIESQYLIKYGTVKTFSEQQLIECTTTTSGCNGGIVANVYKYLMYTSPNGAESDKDYPYTSYYGSLGTCSASQFVPQVKLSSYYYAGTTNEDSIAAWLASYGPLASALNASLLQYYTGGILLSSNTCDPNNVNHAVTLVGYGVSAKGTQYWIVKNSWGASWGLNGYFYLQKGTGLCGINLYVLAPKIA
jgi:C1A family cysteine protease